MTTGVIRSSSYALRLCVAASTGPPGYLNLRSIAIAYRGIPGQAHLAIERVFRYSGGYFAF
jgi:hypothetical protein